VSCIVVIVLISAAPAGRTMSNTAAAVIVVAAAAAAATLSTSSSLPPCHRLCRLVSQQFAPLVCRPTVKTVNVTSDEKRRVALSLSESRIIHQRRFGKLRQCRTAT